MTMVMMTTVVMTMVMMTMVMTMVVMSNHEGRVTGELQLFMSRSTKQMPTLAFICTH